jgi:hypothetical protein
MENAALMQTSLVASPSPFILQKHEVLHVQGKQTVIMVKAI